MSAHYHSRGGIASRAAPGTFTAILTAGLSLLILSGCTSLMSKNPGLELEAAQRIIPSVWSRSIASDYSLARPSTLPADWWLGFQDPLMSTLIVQAMENNTSVLIAQASLRQSRALRDVAAAALLPVVAGSAMAKHSIVGGKSSGNQFALGFDANWELDIFGVNRHALTVSEASLAASSASLADVKTSIAAEVALDYILLRGSQSRLFIARENLTSQRATLEITDWRQQAGLVSALQVEQAKTIVAQTTAQLAALQTSIVQTCHAIAVLIGQSPASLVNTLASEAPVPRPMQTIVLSIPAETLRQRPDVRVAEEQVRAAIARVSQADAMRMPSFNIGGSFGLSAMSLSALGNSSAIVSSLLAGVSLPIFNGGALRAQVQAQEAALDQANAVYHANILIALSETENALVALHNDRQRLFAMQQAADAASQAAQLARQLFGAGLVDFQVVNETQRTQFSTQDNVAVANTDLSADHVRLYKALGGGWRSN
ncbi:efflux transporter outer membrane subunit [Undibacterium sp. Ji22W]|uniref:efflux transporter outer membrane subunit n=1 Tax=Undibacterium sp. Ji22W TaxID=3413038 RepID=UPI003BF1F464